MTSLTASAKDCTSLLTESTVASPADIPLTLIVKPLMLVTSLPMVLDTDVYVAPLILTLAFLPCL